MSKTYNLKQHTVRASRISVTEEEIKRLAIEAGIIEPEKVEKPFGELYVNNEHGGLLYYTDNRSGFGFDRHGQWLKVEGTLFPLHMVGVQPATDSDKQRWKQLLLEKAESMGYENGNYKCLYMPKDTEQVSDEFFLDCEGHVWMGIENKVTYNMVFNGETGEWAQIIIPELTHAQIEEKIGKFKYKG